MQNNLVPRYFAGYLKITQSNESISKYCFPGHYDPDNLLFPLVVQNLPDCIIHCIYVVVAGSKRFNSGLFIACFRHQQKDATMNEIRHSRIHIIVSMASSFSGSLHLLLFSQTISHNNKTHPGKE